jgi:hypothetical protein
MRRLDDLVRRAIPLNDRLPPELLARLGLDGAAKASPASVDNIIDFATVRAARNEAAQSRTRGLSTPATQRWFRSVQAAAVVGIALVGMQWLPSAQPPAAKPGFRTLSDAATTERSGNAIVMFASGIDAGEARMLVTPSGARLVGKPSGTGAWRLAIDPARRDAVLKSLRATPGVTMAEPIDGADR